MKIKLVFFGTGRISAAVLQKLLEDERFEVELVVTKPDDRSGRGQKLKAHEVKSLALERNLKVIESASLKGENADMIFHSLELTEAKFLVVVAYGFIIPKKLLSLSGKNWINLHFSKLPELRGAAPIVRALLSGQTSTGVTVMKLVQEMDAGAILLQQTLPIDAEENALTLENKMVNSGSEILITALLAYDGIVPIEQNDSLATFAPKIKKEELQLNFNESAVLNERKIRAFYPQGCFNYLDGKLVKFYKAKATTKGNNWEKNLVKNGTLVGFEADNLLVACEGSTLQVAELQLESKKREAAKSFITRNKFYLGKVFYRKEDEQA